LYHEIQSKINDQLARSPKQAELHPLQDESTVQGILEVMYRLEGMLKEISGMERVSLQPGAGSAAIYANICMIRAYHTARGEGNQRDEVITTIFSHPSNAAAAKVAGYKIITLYPDKDGYPDLEALRAAVSERTAALMITNPEDTGIFNPRIEEFVKIVHTAGGLCSYDQANANGILGITRALEAGFDTCHFNLHKTFSTPHGCGGPAAGERRGAAGALPARPTVEFDGRVISSTTTARRCGQDPPFYGVAQNLLKAYAWIMSLGADGLREVAETAVLNNNYLMKKVLEIRAPAPPTPRGNAHRAGALQLGTALRGYRRTFRRDRLPRRRFRDALLDQPPPLRGARADDAGPTSPTPKPTWTSMPPCSNKLPMKPIRIQKASRPPHTTAPSTRPITSHSTTQTSGRSPGERTCARPARKKTPPPPMPSRNSPQNSRPFDFAQ
jgi:hypothetical protein